MSSKEEYDLQDARKFLYRLDSDSNTCLFHRVDKLREVAKLHRAIKRYESYFKEAQNILELGGGTFWASYLVKKLYPEAIVTASDLAVPSLSTHERLWLPVFETKIDRAISCQSYELPIEDASLDLVFCFESAHHFGKHDRTLKEIFRVLKPGGTALYLCEPSCTEQFYPMAHARVNRPGHGYGVPEDVLIYKRIIKLAEKHGFKASVHFDPHTINRGDFEFFYYSVLKRIPFAASLLPCTANYVFERPQTGAQ